MAVKQRKAFEDYSAGIPSAVVAGWEEMVRAWEEDPTNPDPYQEPTACMFARFARTRRSLTFLPSDLPGSRQVAAQ